MKTLLLNRNVFAMNTGNFDFSVYEFHPVIVLPADYEVFDFTQGYDPNREHMPYGIGRYDEKRAGMYTTEIFSSEHAENRGAARNVHVGIDIGAPVGTSVHAFYAGEVFLQAINAADGDYGGTLITKHRIGERDLWALHGHLSHESLNRRKIGERFEKGAVIASVGEKKENGGWNPHLHFQLSWVKPEVCDLPGVVSDADREKALKLYPDPRLVLGAVY